MATMNPVALTFERILVPTDFSEISQRALEFAKVIAKQGNSELLLLHVDPPIDSITPPEAAWIDLSEVQAQREEQMEQSGAALRSEGFRARTILGTGPLCGEILSTVKQYKVDLIVLGTHGKKGLERLMLGSDAEAVLRHAGCPVLSVGPAVPNLQNKTWRIREILCAMTLDPRSAEVVACAHKLAELHHAELVLFHVKSSIDQKDDAGWVSFDQAFDRYIPKGFGTRPELRTHVAGASPGTSIADLAKQRGSDLIVMGAHPASWFVTHLARGIAAKVLAEAPCPVITLLQS
ncbi:MAG: universal stress protein [Acidobacteriaceae bacterium]|jgi:nucleotide-binding universal stress UspA family protein